MAIKKVALLTAGGLAPCLSAAIGRLIERYTEVSPETEIIAYIGGYKGLLLGDSIEVNAGIRENAAILYKHGGSPIGNSRVKLTNVKDCEKRGLVKEGENPLEVAANQLIKDGVEVLHTIGGDDTNTTAADLAAYLAENGYKLIVVGLPKTIDNDVFPIQQSLGAWTAAEEGAKYFANVVAEHNANPRMLIVHEVMGRSCGWLTAYTAKVYHENLEELDFLPNIGLSKARKDVHAIFIPEMEVDIAAEAKRLRKTMDDYDNVNIFISEGAGLETIVKEMEAAGEEVPRDAFGHAKLGGCAAVLASWQKRDLGKELNTRNFNAVIPSYLYRSGKPTQVDRDNAIRLGTAIGGSTNLALHIPAIGYEADSEVTMARFEELARSTPHIAKMNPAAPLNVPDFHAAGGVPAVMQEILPLLHGDALTVTGKTVAENVAHAPVHDRRIIKTLAEPWSAGGGLAILSGNLAPNSAITKPAAIVPEMRTFTGTARCFDSEEDANRAILDGKVQAGEVVVIRYEGPKGGPGMREMYIAMKLLYGRGLALSTALITDGRFSGTNNGCFVGHISPEAAEGGPLAVVEDGDTITIDIPNRSLHLHVSDAEIAARLARWQHPEPKIKRGYLALYARLAESADKGAIIRHKF